MSEWEGGREGGRKEIRDRQRDRDKEERKSIKEINYRQVTVKT